MAMDQATANYTFAEIVEGTVNVIDRLPTATHEWGMLAGFQPVSNPDNEKLHGHDNSHYAAGTAHYRLGVSGIADKAAAVLQITATRSGANSCTALLMYTTPSADISDATERPWLSAA